jgi:hypothetical protein
MVCGSHGLARTPWSWAQFYNQALVVFEWLDKHDHFSVYQQVLSIAALSSTKRVLLICRCATLCRLKYLNTLINKVSNKEELTYGLICAARGGQLEVVQRLIDAGAGINASAGKWMDGQRCRQLLKAVT